jgi:alkylation response protein AidB-like acyl-CoA dehydrogenase
MQALSIALPNVGEHPVQVARGLLPLLAEHAEQCEREGRVAGPVIDAIRRAGLFKMMFPKRAGGVGHKLITHLETVAELGKACPGTAWAFSLLSSVTAAVASMPGDIPKQVFATGDELACSVAAQTGTAEPSLSGYKVSGRWGYGSGCLHADWALNGVRVVDADGVLVDVGFALLSLKHPQVKIETTWHVAGVAGSGSNTIVADEVPVPAGLILRFSQLRRNLANDPLALAALEPRDKWPVEPLFPLAVIGSMFGAAEAVLERVSGRVKTQPVIGWKYPTQSDSQIFVGEIGTAAMEIDSAWLHVRRAAAEIDETAQQRPLDGFEKARIQADCGYAMSLLRRAAERLMDVAGPSGFALANPLQRFWRDLSFGSRHTALNTRLGLELYGRARLGLDSNFNLLSDIKPATH